MIILNKNAKNEVRSDFLLGFGPSLKEVWIHVEMDGCRKQVNVQARYMKRRR